MNFNQEHKGQSKITQTLKRTIALPLIMSSYLLLTACGGDSGGVSLQIAAAGGTEACKAFTVTRSEAADQTLNVMPDLNGNEGGLYANASCTQIAVITPITIAVGSKTAQFYYAPGSAEGEITLKVTTLSGMSVDAMGSITFSLD